MNDDEIYTKALALWGKNAQTNMVIEECTELIHILMKDKRGKASFDDIMSELVDVQITINQLRVILNDESKYNQWMAFKLDRLQKLIEGSTS